MTATYRVPVPYRVRRCPDGTPTPWYVVTASGHVLAHCASRHLAQDVARRLSHRHRERFYREHPRIAGRESDGR